MSEFSFDYLEQADWDLRCSHCNDKKEEKVEYCLCPQMIVATYGREIIDIEIREPITPWKSNYHTVIRMDLNEADFLYRQLERFIHGFTPKHHEVNKRDQD